MKRTLFHGTLILFAASLFNRIVGFTYQIFLIDLIGAQGIGLFNMVYPIYILAVVLATAGLPVAISKFVAAEKAKGNLAGAYRIFYISLAFLGISSTLVTLLLYTFLPQIQTHIFPNPKGLMVFKVLLPAILVVPVCSAFRGFFQGLLDMLPTATTQVLEQVTRVSLGLFFASLYFPKGIEYAAAGAAIGTVVGEFVGFALMLFLFVKRKPRLTQKGPVRIRKRQILNELLTLSIPVTLTKIMSTMVLSLEASIIPKQLALAGLTIEEATTLYGQLTGMGITIIVLPSVLTTSLATALIPAVSAAAELNNKPLLTERIIEALRITVITGAPAVTLFFLLPCQITDLLFHNPEAGHTLKVLAVGGLFYYLQQTTSAILQGLGQATVPFRNLIAASLLEMVGLLILVKQPQLTILGAAWSVNISFIVLAVLNLWYVSRYLQLEKRHALILGRLLIAAFGMGFTLLLTYKAAFVCFNSNTVSLLSALLCSALIYLLLTYRLEVIYASDFKRIPFLRQLRNMAYRLFQRRR